MTRPIPGLAHYVKWEPWHFVLENGPFVLLPTTPQGVTVAHETTICILRMMRC